MPPPETEPRISSIVGCRAAATAGRRRHRSPSPDRDRHRRHHEGDGQGLKGSSLARRVSDSSESDGSRSDGRHRRRCKERGRGRRGKESRRRHRGRSRGSDDDDSEISYDSVGSGDGKRRKRSRRSSRNGSRSRRKKSRGSDSHGSGKPSGGARSNVKTSDEPKEALEFREMIEEAPPGPMPMPQPRAEAQIVKYGGALRPGEGDAMAQFVQQGKRIPRRGEVGLTAEEIQRFEAAGYVMSGSRHSRITAVRLRKENQVYSAEEKRRALATFNYEQKAARERKVRDDLRRLVDRALGKLAQTAEQHDPFADK
ncbi:LOW QUALITY PROTEIN: NF-kappa-B-activating protein-like [Brachypodium distachyon]|uniref:LOW QUALITY PROTEIN: NF-kappa-B-activating protein-like n=1 Tax=Brachypodium distachyon TaxID=15368 RepID=UPI00052FF739|nr:LOW QUALITY PROTEIN: NF-kappa-B-activating protein-like [Brachypodium distachyon]|eukprot:XP_010235214.1 LOW QUALITY PROTEIN: NF-kappa-B-activating protein-like [Brachypodium distachyon]